MIVGFESQRHTIRNEKEVVMRARRELFQEPLPPMMLYRPRTAPSLVRLPAIENDTSPDSLHEEATKLVEEIDEGRKVKSKSKRKDACVHMESLLRDVIKKIPVGEANAMKRPDIMRMTGLGPYDHHNYLALVLFKNIAQRPDVGQTHRDAQPAWYIKDITDE